MPKEETRVNGDHHHTKDPDFVMTVMLVFTKPNFEHVYSRLERVV
jgi:hypothetical protein